MSFNEDMERSRAAMRAELHGVADKLGFGIPSDVEGPDAGRSDKRRAAGRRVSSLRRSIMRSENPIGLMTLYQTDDGIFTFHEGAAAIARSGRRSMRRRDTALPPGSIVSQLPYEKIGINEVTRKLEELDRVLTPNMNTLRKWNGITLDPCDPPITNKRTLVLIHGTFSNSENYFAAFNKTHEGRNLLSKAKAIYGDNIYTFDHPTLSVGPILNGLDLARRFAKVTGQVDVISHSRGGIVVRWWREVFSRVPVEGNVALVGSPLGGTTLASPTHIRGAIDFFANVNSALGHASAAAAPLVPFLTVAAGLFKVVHSVMKVASHTPIIDAAIALIPGLAGQARVENALELERLRNHNLQLPKYYVVQSNFVPERVPVWKFWHWFREPKNRLAHWGANWVFDQPNDLVVDTSSMTDLVVPRPEAPFPIDQLFDFGISPKVHHTNYFEQRETLDFLMKKVMG